MWGKKIREMLNPKTKFRNICDNKKGSLMKKELYFQWQEMLCFKAIKAGFQSRTVKALVTIKLFVWTENSLYFLGNQLAKTLFIQRMNFLGHCIKTC